jgi:hypothetical protein
MGFRLQEQEVIENPEEAFLSFAERQKATSVMKNALV